MEINGGFVLLLMVLFVSHASLFINSGVLAGEEAPKDNSTTQNPPLLGPVSDPTPAGNRTSNDKPTESQLSDTNSATPNPHEIHKSDSGSPPPQVQTGKESNVSKLITDAMNPPPEKQSDSKGNEKRSEKTEPASPPPSAPPPPKSPEKVPHKANSDKDRSPATSTETCVGISNKCRDDKTMVACTLSIQRDSEKWLILVQNEGDESIKVNIVSSIKKPLTERTIQQHNSQRVNISITEETNKVILDAGHGECVLHKEQMDESKQNTMFIYLPSYEKLVTPINGAYLLIFSVVVFGGTWACCCLFRKNRRPGGSVPYQELEMGSGPGSGTRDVETADWDESWDDDWDETSAVKSPGGAKNVSISSNGLTARGSSRDGWDNDWDD